MYQSFIQTLTIFFSLSALPFLQGYNFAHEAKKITNYFEDNHIDSAFAKELYSSIDWATDNFTHNCSFAELERFVPNDYLDYMSHFMVTKDSNLRIALIWPTRRAKSSEIFHHFSNHYEIISYKRILLSEEGSINFINQVPGLTAESHFSLLFNPPVNKYTPTRVYLLKTKDHEKHEVDEIRKKCISSFGTGIYITQNHKDTIRLSQTVFNRNSLDCIKHRDSKTAGLSIDKLKLSTIMTTSNFSPEDIVLSNEATFYIYGYHKCKRLPYFSKGEINLTSEYSSLLIKAPEYNSSSDLLYMFEGAEGHHTNIGFNRRDTLERTITIDDLIYNPKMYLYYRGVKYSTLEVCMYLMKQQNHPLYEYYKNTLLKKIQ